MISFIAKKPKQPEPKKHIEVPESESEAASQPRLQPTTHGPLPIEDPYIQKILKDFYKSEYWPYIKEALFAQIIYYQQGKQKQLEGTLADPKDVNGKLASFLGGQVRAGEEFKKIIEGMKRLTLR